ncbi:hypothetical protein ES702_01556 [subsurface metagenome]
MKSDVGKQVREKIAVLLTTAFGLVAALAWNGAIRAIFVKIFGTADTIVGMLTYAIVVTIIGGYCDCNNCQKCCQTGITTDPVPGLGKDDLAHFYEYTYFRQLKRE